MKQKARILSIVIAGSLSLLATSGGAIYAATQKVQPQSDAALIKQGQWVFRHDTFGDYIKWTNQLHMNKVISTSISPATALALGLKVDVDALPESVKQGILNGTVNLNSPQTTLALLELNAVVGLQGTVVKNPDGSLGLTKVGVTCALCHSTVDNSFAPGIGHRLDGWPNRQLNPGRIIALSPALNAAQKAQLNSWGPGMYDPRWNFDGLSDPTVIPPAYGLKGVNRVVFTGDGPNLSYWNRYVAVTQMGGQGVFSDPRVGTHLNPHTPGLAPNWHPGAFMANGTKDLVTSALPALQAYQLSIPAPPPPAGSFDLAAAARGKVVFSQAGCASCHSGPALTDANTRLHRPTATPARDKLYVYRSATGMWRTSPLHGLWQHPPYFHDGSAKTLADAVQMYNAKLNLKLTPKQQSDLTQYLKSL
ncbi:MAG: c-type cytochrome [Rhodanobacteraceae bacterium]